jgi:hypothetical protein
MNIPNLNWRASVNTHSSGLRPYVWVSASKGQSTGYARRDFTPGITHLLQNICDWKDEAFLRTKLGLEMKCEALADLKKQMTESYITAEEVESMVAKLHEDFEKVPGPDRTATITELEEMGEAALVPTQFTEHQF